MSKTLIFDIGMNDGKDTGFYLHLGYDVLAVDANRQLCQKCDDKFLSYLLANKVKILNLAISDSDKKAQDFFINKEKDEWSSLIPEVGGRNGMPVDVVSVETTTLTNLILLYGKPYYIKIDIEGYDVVALQSLKDCPADLLPEYISVEADNTGLLDILKSLGYNKFKMVNQGYMNRNSFKDWNFEEGSSGTFGEDTHGEWLPIDEVKELFNQPHPQYCWYDFHAKK